MESRPVLPHNKPKACHKPESRSKTQHQETTVPPGMREGVGSFHAKKKAKLIDIPMQTKTPTRTVIPSTPTTLTPSSPTASPATLKTLLGPGTTASSVTSTTILMTNFPDKHAVGINQEPKASKSIHKTTSQVSASTDFPKSLQKPPSTVLTATALHKSVQRATLSQIPNPKIRSSPTGVDQTKTFCKVRSKELEPSCAHRFKFNDNGGGVMEDSQEVDNVQPLGTSKVEMLQRTKDEEKHRDRKEDCILKDIQVVCTFKGSDIAAQVTSHCPLFPLDSIQLSPGATTSSASQMKETAGKADENTMDCERECEKEKRREWKKSVERKEDLEKKVGHKGKDEKKKLEENVEKEKKVQDGNNKAKERERKEKEKNLKQILKNLKEAATMTEEIPVPVKITDPAMQTEVLYEDAEIQAVVEVSNKFTSMSPNITHSSWSHTDPQVNPSIHDQVTGAGSGSVSVHNGLSQDISLDSGLSPVSSASVGLSLNPTPHKSSLSSKPNRQHVCQIQIELCSQSILSDSLALPVDEKSQVGLERKPKQVDTEGDQVERGPLPEVAWDEQGLTWEVYGAAVDMEFLGFAIQNHLQHKIHEHEQRIRHLRKSVSFSEHSNGEGRGAIKKKKKSNVFWSLFQRPTCCLKTESEV